MNTQRRQWLRALVAVAAASAWPLRADDTAPYEVLDLDWQDTARQRAVPVRLHLPHSTQAPHRLPLVVFSHGIGGTRRGYSWLAQHLARHGVASLHLQHVGSDRQVWTGGVLNIVGRLQSAAQDQEAVARVHDLRFALDTLLRSEWAPRIDEQRLVAAGHSYGANTTLLACGARVERSGQLYDLRDERLKAAVVISAPPFYGEADPGRILQSVTVPSLHVTSTEDIIRIPGYYSGADDRVAVFDATGSQRKWLAVFQGGSHSMFTDRAGTGGVSLNPQVKDASRALVLAFLRQVLDGEAQGLQQWPQRHAGILARFTAPTTI
jgi:predicted dienelactone hydrolase